MRKQEGFLVATLVLSVLGMGTWGCSRGPTSTPGLNATRTKEVQDYFATMTSQAGEPSPTPSDTPTPTPTCAPTTYIVETGDTLARSTARYGTTAEAICAFNELPDCSLIHTGQELLIPCEDVTPTRTHTPTPTTTPTFTPTPTVTATATPTPTATPTFTPSPTISCWGGCSEHIQGCDIKGNISYETGEKIYHVPGGQYYEATIIRPEYGERWFCAEEEAIAAGWRRSKR